MMPRMSKITQAKMITPLISVTEDELRTQPSLMYTCTLLIIRRQPAAKNWKFMAHVIPITLYEYGLIVFTFCSAAK